MGKAPSGRDRRTLGPLRLILVTKLTTCRRRTSAAHWPFRQNDVGPATDESHHSRSEPPQECRGSTADGASKLKGRPNCTLTDPCVPTSAVLYHCRQWQLK